MADDKKRDTERDAILATFLLSAADAAAFADAIYEARLSSLTGAYAAVADDIGADVSEWEPPDAVLAQMARDAKANGASIVETYNASITREAEAYTGDDLRADLAQWVADRASWKVEQISLYETGKGYSAGMDQFISDVLADEVDLPDDVTLADLVVVVEPSEAAEPICADLVAGSPYPIDEADDVIDVFPIHPGCVHWSSVTFAS